MATILDELLEQERELQFASFDEKDAWKLGCLLVGRAERDDLPIAIDISASGRRLFHAAMKGSCADNDAWIQRKARLVERFGHSSFYIGQYLKSVGKRIEDAYLLPESEYAPHGGSFPLIVAGSGAIGSVTVSGLPQEEDHKLVVRTIRTFLGKEE
jgi:uncharacterized protein (UPF0303 family)